MPSKSTVSFSLHVLFWSLIPGNAVCGVGLEAALLHGKHCSARQAASL